LRKLEWRFEKRWGKGFLIGKAKLILVINMGIKVRARYENEMLKPLEKLDLKEGEDVEIDVPISVVNMTYAVSKLSDEIIEEIIETTENGERDSVRDET